MDTVGYCECEGEDRAYSWHTIQVEQPILFYRAISPISLECDTPFESYAWDDVAQKRRWHGFELEYQLTINGVETCYRREYVRYNEDRELTARTLTERGDPYYGYDPVWSRSAASLMLQSIETQLIIDSGTLGSGESYTMRFSFKLFDEYTNAKLLAHIQQLWESLSWADMDTYADGALIAWYGQLLLRIPLTWINHEFVIKGDSRTLSGVDNFSNYVASRGRTGPVSELNEPFDLSGILPFYGNELHVESRSKIAINNNPDTPGYHQTNFILTKTFDGEEIQTEEITLTDEPQLFEMPEGKFGYMQLFPL